MEMDDNLQQQLLMTQSQMMEQMRQMQQTQVSLSETMRQDSTKRESLFQKEMQSELHASTNIKNVDMDEDKIFENTFSKNSAFQPLAAAADNLLTSRSYLLGAESMQQKQSDTRQQIQMGALNAVGGAAETATSVGSFFVPGGFIASTALGLGAGAAVSYGTKQMIDGAKDALNYQSILEEKGYKAFNIFEGQNDFGGIGMTLNQQQDLSSYMRDLEPEKLLNSDEMSKILSGALDGKLLKSTTDLKSFKKKFSEIVDTVKEVSVVMNSSLEEATKMMGELESRGIGGGKATMLAAQAKVNASIMGVDSKQVFSNNLEASSELSVGSGIEQSKTLGLLGNVTYVTTQLMDQYKKDEDKQDLYQYIKNNGGEQVIANRGTDVIMNELGRNQNTNGLVAGLIGYAADFDESGRLTFDKKKIEEATEKGYDAQQLTEMSFDNMNRFSPGQREQLVNNAAEEIKQSLNLNEMAGVWRSLIDQQTMGDERKRSEVLVSLGVAKDSKEAEILTDQIYESDTEATREYTGLSTREALSSIKRVNSPGPFQQGKADWKRWVTNPLGDIGQAVSDEAGNATLAIQQAINNVDSKKGVKSKYLLKGEAFTKREEFEKALYTGEESAAKTFNENIQKVIKTDKSKNAPKEDIIAAPDGPMDYYTASRAFENPNMMKEDMKKLEPDETRIDEYMFSGKEKKSGEMRQQQFNMLLSRAQANAMSVAEVSRLRDDMENGTYTTKESKVMAQSVIDVASGKKKVEDLDQDLLMKGATEGEKDLSDLDDGKKTVKQIRKDLEKKMDKITKETAKAADKAKKSAMRLDLNEEDAAKMDRALRARDFETIRSMTDDKDMLAAAEKMEKANSKLVAGREASGALAQIIDNTAAKADVAQSTVDLMVSSKAMTKDDAQRMFNDVLEQRKAVDKGIKGGWSLDRIQQESAVLQDMMDGKMSSLTETEAKKFAAGISNLNDADEYKMDFFKSDTGDGIDREKLTKAMEAIVVAGATKDGDAVKAGDADKALGDHKDAMGKMLKTVSEEVAMMKKATKNIKNGTPFQYSSITGK